MKPDFTYSFFDGDHRCVIQDLALSTPSKDEYLVRVSEASWMPIAI